jgi:hypothetical protein
LELSDPLGGGLVAVNSLSPVMKWVLRAAGTGYFLKEDGSFTMEFNEAYNLPNVKVALELCHRKSLIGMELVLRLGSVVEAAIQMGDVC